MRTLREERTNTRTGKERRTRGGTRNERREDLERGERSEQKTGESPAWLSTREEPLFPRVNLPGTPRLQGTAGQGSDAFHGRQTQGGGG